MSIASTSVTASSSPARHSHYSEEYYPVSEDLSQNEHYIYVTYPPDLKRRLLERYDFYKYIGFKVYIIKIFYDFINLPTRIVDTSLPSYLSMIW